MSKKSVHLRGVNLFTDTLYTLKYLLDGNEVLYTGEFCSWDAMTDRFAFIGEDDLIVHGDRVLVVDYVDNPKALDRKKLTPDVRSHNVGDSNYADFKIQPWDIWKEYNLNPWDADIVKRILRTKKTDSRIMDYEKIIHICQERIRQLKG